MLFLHIIYLIRLGIVHSSDLELYLIWLWWLLRLLQSPVFIVVELINFILARSFVDLWILIGLWPESVISLITVVHWLYKWTFLMLVYISILDVLLVLLGRLIDGWVFIVSNFLITIQVWWFGSIILGFIKIYSCFWQRRQGALRLSPNEWTLVWTWQFNIETVLLGCWLELVLLNWVELFNGLVVNLMVFIAHFDIPLVKESYWSVKGVPHLCHLVLWT